MLPYTDTKPQGAADFYFAINATFRFIHKRLGQAAWIEYLNHLARSYFRPVNESWLQNGLPAIAAYWKAFFQAEPNAEVAISQTPDEVTVEVFRCPAIAHLRAAKREIVPFYCQHCYHLGAARAAEAGFSMTLEGGNGTCRHIYRHAADVVEQDLSKIKEVSPC